MKIINYLLDKYFCIKLYERIKYYCKFSRAEAKIEFYKGKMQKSKSFIIKIKRKDQLEAYYKDFITDFIECGFENYIRLFTHDNSIQKEIIEVLKGDENND